VANAGGEARVISAQLVPRKERVRPSSEGGLS